MCPRLSIRYRAGRSGCGKLARFCLHYLGYGVGYVESLDGVFEVVQVFFVGKFRVMVTDNHQALPGVLLVPFPQRGNYVLAINSTISPHIYQDDLAAQVGQPQGAIGVQPDLVG